jgi:hypothetical protein
VWRVTRAAANRGRRIDRPGSSRRAQPAAIDRRRPAADFNARAGDQRPTHPIAAPKRRKATAPLRFARRPVEVVREWGRFDPPPEQRRLEVLARRPRLDGRHHLPPSAGISDGAPPHDDRLISVRFAAGVGHVNLLDRPRRQKVLFDLFEMVQKGQRAWERHHEPRGSDLIDRRRSSWIGLRKAVRAKLDMDVRAIRPHRPGNIDINLLDFRAIHVRHSRILHLLNLIGLGQRIGPCRLST